MIQAEHIREGLLIAVQGRLDSSTAEEFRKAVLSEISAADRVIVLDLADVTFVSSAGLRALLLIAKSRNVEVRLCCLRSEVQPMFSMSGFDRLLTILETREEAFT